MKDKINFVKRLKNKKGQEEIVGFVLIVVIVVIIMVILLGFMLRQPSTKEARRSLELGTFASSMLSYTTECEIPKTTPQKIKDLIRRCNERNVCDNGKSACEIMETELKEIVAHSSYKVDEGSYTRYFSISTYSNQTNTSLIQPIIIGNVEGCNLGVRVINEQPLSGGIGDLIYFRVEACFES